VNELYKESYKLLKKESEEDFRGRKDLSYSWIGRMNILKMPILPKVVGVHVKHSSHQNPNGIHQSD
jgi:hypothetical protein